MCLIFARSNKTVSSSFFFGIQSCISMRRLIYLIILTICISQGLQAQVELVPITENPVLQRQALEQQLPEALRQRLLITEKNACDSLEKPGVQYVLSGKTVAVQLRPDTSGLGAVDFTCVACESKLYGNAFISGDTLYYTANGRGDFGEDRIEVSYCSKTAPANCRSTFYRFFVHRAGQTIYPLGLSLPPGGRTAPLPFGSDFIKKPGCDPVILDCGIRSDDRNKGEAMILASKSSYQLVYQAGRYPSTDSVCVVLCDTLAVCDTFKFAFKVVSDTLSIPFMDDFSYFGPYPDAGHWLDQDAFVNNDMAQDTLPSWGVATFDGLNSNGKAYGGGYGESDRLTSKFINLSNVSDSVFLTFWLQPRGLGDRPEIQDSFVVEFKTRNGQWQQMESFPGLPISTPSTTNIPFQFHSIAVPKEFKNNNFQFRFRNYSDRTGILDVWHLDYVRLDRNAKDSIFSDIAFTRFPNFILKRYSSMPWWQFRGNEEKELYDFVKVNIWNHFDQTQPANDSKVRLFETHTNTEVYSKTLFNGIEANIPKGNPISKKYSLQGDNSGFPNFWMEYLQQMKNDNYKNYERLDFRLEYVFRNTAQQNVPGYKEAVDRNDSVRRFTTFDNYFAYDDGTAESGLIAQQGVQVAMRFELNKPDTLRAIQFHFPRTTVDIADQRFSIKVWVDQLDDTPEYLATGQRAYYADIYFDTLQGFTTYPLINENGQLTPLALPAGTFYVGWEQETACDGTHCIPVGYDRNSPDAFVNAFRKNSSQWQAFPPISKGALMIRPVVGSKTPQATSTDEPLLPDQNFVLFPNPTQESLNITPTQGWYEDFQYQLFSSTGQLLKQGALQPQLGVTDLPPGVYFIKIANRQSNQIWNERFIIAR